MSATATKKTKTTTKVTLAWEPSVDDSIKNNEVLIAAGNNKTFKSFGNTPSCYLEVELDDSKPYRFKVSSTTDKGVVVVSEEHSFIAGAVPPATSLIAYPSEIDTVDTERLPGIPDAITDAAEQSRFENASPVGGELDPTRGMQSINDILNEDEDEEDYQDDE